MKEGAGDGFPKSPTLAYQDAEYDTDPGISATRRRVGRGAAVDMERSTGRVGLGDEDLSAGRGYFSDFDGGRHTAASNEEGIDIYIVI